MKIKVRILQAAVATALLALTAGQSLATQIDIAIDKTTQHMRVSIDGRQTYDWPVSTAGRGYNTPSGHFHVFRLEKDHFSQEWDNAPMPNSMFFTGIGHALHGSYHIATLGQAVSHGCVRLLPANAIILYDLIEKAGFKNNSVTITGGFFDASPQLTTEETFHMAPNDFGHGTQSANADPIFSTDHHPFWWQRPDPLRVLTNFKPAHAEVKPVHSVKLAKGEKKKKGKGKNKTVNFFDFLKENQG